MITNCCNEVVEAAGDKISPIDDDLGAVFSDMTPQQQKKYDDSLINIKLSLSLLVLVACLACIIQTATFDCLEPEIKLPNSDTMIVTLEPKMLTHDNAYIMQLLEWKLMTNTTDSQRLDIKACAKFDPPHSLPMGMIFSGSGEYNNRMRMMAPIHSCGTSVRGVVARSHKNNVHIVLGGPHVKHVNITIQLEITRLNETRRITDCEALIVNSDYVRLIVPWAFIISFAFAFLVFICRDFKLIKLWDFGKKKE